MPAGGLVALGVGGGIASLFGSKNAANAAKSAAQTQAQYGQQALARQQGVYNDTKANMAPYEQAGQSALKNLMSQYGNQTPQSMANNLSGYVNQARNNPYGMPFSQTQNQGGPSGYPPFPTIGSMNGQPQQAPQNQGQPMMPPYRVMG